MRQDMARSGRKQPLAKLLVERGVFESEDEARRWIMAGKVLVDEQRIDKPGMPVPAGAPVRVLGRQRYASRGGYKLEAALEHFRIDVTGRVALDCGASTGGFTDCLLRHGASLVYAVEAGYGQLIGRLRADPRVRNLERTNLGDPALTTLDPPPTLVTLDLSYLSLTRALPIAATILAAEGEVLALVKPLFEVESAEARRSGQITDPSLFVAVLRRVLDARATAGLIPQGVARLALPPRHGVSEFFAYFVRGTDQEYAAWDYDDELLRRIVDEPGIGVTDIM